jgi:cell division septation protein DedD
MGNSEDSIEVELTAIDREAVTPSAKSVIRLILVGIALAALVAFAGVVWYAYNTGIREGSEFAAPVLKPKGPSKTAPQSPGGENVPHRNKKVYSLIDKSPISNNVERFAPPPENPLPHPSTNASFDDPPALPEPSLKAPSAPPTAMNPPPPSITVKRRIAEGVPVAPTTLKTETPKTPAPIATTATENTTPTPTKLKPAPKAPPKSITVLTAAAPVIAPKPVVPPKTQVATGLKSSTGAYLIQIASLKSAESVRRAWDQYLKRHKGLFVGLKLFVRTKSIKGRGVFHRVQVGPFANQAQARAKCTVLRTNKIPCLVIRP